MPGTPGTRDGMLPGMHSTHLGAYESSPGVWVWGDRPSASGDASGGVSPAGGIGGGYGTAGHPGSLGGMLGLPADFGSSGVGVAGIVGGLLGMGGPASEISSGEDAPGSAEADVGDHFGGSGYD